MGLFGKKQATPKLSPQGWLLPPSNWEAAVLGGNYRVEVVGATSYKRERTALRKEYGVGGHPSSEDVGLAFLFPQPSNQLGPDTVAVVVGQSQVGLVDPKDCPWVQVIITELATRGKYPLCKIRMFIRSKEWAEDNPDSGVIGLTIFIQDPPQDN